MLKDEVKTSRGVQAAREDVEAERRGRSDSIRGRARTGNWGLLDPERRDSQESLLPWPPGRGGEGVLKWSQMWPM